MQVLIGIGLLIKTFILLKTLFFDKEYLHVLEKNAKKMKVWLNIFYCAYECKKIFNF